MPFGATVRPGGGTDFRLWAPAAKSVDLVLHPSPPPCARAVRLSHPFALRSPPPVRPEPVEGPGRGFDKLSPNGPLAPSCTPERNAEASRTPDGDGWWLCEVPQPATASCTSGGSTANSTCPTRRRASTRTASTDRAAWSTRAPSSGTSGWTGRPWHEVVLYELHVGAFTPEGTFAAAAQRLQALADVGITAVELMPLADFPGRFGWGYDGVLPFAPHAAYGTPDDLKRFVQQAHRLGLMVFLDVVYNHFGPDGNYLHRYAPQFFSATRSSPWGAAINFDGDGSRWVREFFIHNAVYWIHEYRFDGLRLDAVHAIADSSRPHVLEELSRRVREATPGRHVHLVLENENNDHERLATTPEPGRYDAPVERRLPPRAARHADRRDAAATTTTTATHPARRRSTCWRAASPTACCSRTAGASPAARARRPRPTPAHPALGAGELRPQPRPGRQPRVRRAAGACWSGPDAAPLATLLALLTPAVPMLFLGEEFGSTQPWLYFADWEGDLREGGAGRPQARVRPRDEDRGRQGAGPARPVQRRDLRCQPARDAERASAQGQRWTAMVRSALAARRQWIAPRHHQLLTGQHTCQRVGDRGLVGAMALRRRPGAGTGHQPGRAAHPGRAAAHRPGGDTGRVPPRLARGCTAGPVARVVRPLAHRPRDHAMNAILDIAATAGIQALPVIPAKAGIQGFRLHWTPEDGRLGSPPPRGRRQSSGVIPARRESRLPIHGTPRVRLDPRLAGMTA